MVKERGRKMLEGDAMLKKRRKIEEREREPFMACLREFMVV